MLTDELLIELEKAHFGRLSAEEQARLDEKLKADDVLKAEAAVYQKIWQGFEATKSEPQIKQFQKWEKDWKETDEEELIEWFINDELGEETKAYIKKKCESDPLFATKVDNQQSLKAGFIALQSENFREKITSWESKPEEAKTRKLSSSWRRPLAIAASVLLLISATFSWWNVQKFSDQALIEKHSSLAITGTTMGSNETTATYLTLFEEAHNSMKNKKYELAAQQFISLNSEPFPLDWSADIKKYYSENIEWNVLLATLGTGKTQGNFMEQLNKIATDSNHDYTEKAQTLQNDLNSFWRF